ncbi:MAG: multicopper oxidase domain-containing protein [Actinobacteria bacterium]|nr:multicopper oxidase domain-containing protein [Actinomycetota bacterium]
MVAELSPEQPNMPTKDESFWTRGITAMMLAAVAMSTVVLGAVAIVAMTRSDSAITSSKELPTTISVELSEFKILMSATTVKPGDVTFQVTNKGNVAHNFAIAKLKLRTEMLNPGQLVTIVASDVAAGSYEIVCDVSGHPEAGMKATLTVSPDAPNADQAMMAGDGGASAMTWQQMDAKMTEVALKFPAKTTGTGNIELAPILSDDGYKVFNITASIIKWEVEPGKFVEGWAYNGQIPGPILRANVGDKVRIVLKNDLPESTSLHLHGVRVPNAMDGVDPYTQKPIEPGQSFTYEFTAMEPAVGMYHSHHNAQVQVPNGLAGALLIGDWKDLGMKVAGDRLADMDGKVDQEVVMVLNDSGTLGLSINGKSFPATMPYTMKVGETMLVHYYNEGSMTHPMHLHQPAGLVVAHDGAPLEYPFWADTLNVAPGERWTVAYTPKDAGVWAWHCHILTHAETPTGMRYMVTAVIVADE